MKVLFTSSREWKDTPQTREFFRSQLTELSPEPGRLVHGAARGGDLIMAAVAAALGWAVIPYPIDTRWDGGWPEAGPNRNSRMLRAEHCGEETEPVDVCLALPLPGSKGTWDMVNKAKVAGIRTAVVQCSIVEPRQP